MENDSHKVEFDKEMKKDFTLLNLNPNPNDFQLILEKEGLLSPSNKRASSRCNLYLMI